MAALGLDDDELKSVEQTLARLAQLSSSIQSLKMDILKSNPLPHPYAPLPGCANSGESNALNPSAALRYKPRPRFSSATSRPYWIT